jgi:hypothetical protein
MVVARWSRAAASDLRAASLLWYSKMGMESIGDKASAYLNVGLMFSACCIRLALRHGRGYPGALTVSLVSS